MANWALPALTVLGGKKKSHLFHVLVWLWKLDKVQWFWYLKSNTANKIWQSVTHTFPIHIPPKIKWKKKSNKLRFALHFKWKYCRNSILKVTNFILLILFCRDITHIFCIGFMRFIHIMYRPVHILSLWSNTVTNVKITALYDQCSCKMLKIINVSSESVKMFVWGVITPHEPVFEANCLIFKSVKKIFTKKQVLKTITEQTAKPNAQHIPH